MSDNVRFHSKHHGKAHHTTASPGYHDSAVDPIASSASPFMGNFNLSGSHVYYDTSVAADTSRTIGYTDFVDKYDPMYTTVRTQSSSWTVLSGDYWSVTSNTQHPNTLTNNVGIGTNSADEKLTVAGNISAHGSLIVRALGSNQFFKIEGGTNTLGFKDYDGTTIMTLDGASNGVGIGTSSPAKLLHVENSQDGYMAEVHNTRSSTNSNGVFIRSDNNSSSSYPLFVQNGDGDYVLLVRADGSIGMGSTDPDAVLHVESPSGTKGIRIDVPTSSTAPALQLRYNNATVTEFKADGVSYINSGNVGIGHTAPAQSLTVVGSVSADSYKFPDGTEQTTAATQTTTTPIMVSLTEEDLYAQVGSRKLTFVAPFAFTLSKIRAVVSDPPTGSSLSLSAISTGGPLHSDTVDVAAGAYYGDKSSGLLNTSLADGETIWIDLSAVGSTNAGKGVKIYFYR